MLICRVHHIKYSNRWMDGRIRQRGRKKIEERTNQTIRGEMSHKEKNVGIEMRKEIPLMCRVVEKWNAVEDECGVAETNHRHFCGDEIEISTKLNSSRSWSTIYISFNFIPLRAHSQRVQHHTVLVSGACPSCSHFFFHSIVARPKMVLAHTIHWALLWPLSGTSLCHHIRFNRNAWATRWIGGGSKVDSATESHTHQNTSSFISFYFILFYDECCVASISRIQTIPSFILRPIVGTSHASQRWTPSI